MLEIQPTQSGFTLIELMIGVTIAMLLILLGAPSFTSWIQNTQIRTTAEAIQNGLQLARTEAVRRNGLVRFQMVDTLAAGCVWSTTSSNWIVSQDDATNECGDAPSEATPPRIIQTRTSAEGSRNAVITADEVTATGAAVGVPVYDGALTFNGLGRVAPATLGAGNNVFINITNPTGGACAAAGPMRCLRVVVSSGGQIRMCDPALASTDPQGC